MFTSCALNKTTPMVSIMGKEIKRKQDKIINIIDRKHINITIKDVIIITINVYTFLIQTNNLIKPT